nr:hypothetical protein PJ912_16565 [Pectobacterium colocasium]
MSKEGFNTDDIDSIVARCSKRRRVDESNLKHKTLETGALPSATHDAGVVILSCVANTLSHHIKALQTKAKDMVTELVMRDLVSIVVA